MTTICLSMICKNEQHVILRALDSAAPYVDKFCLVDTGSTDDTLNTILTRDTDKETYVHERPWVNFAHNRQEALELAKERGCDYVLFLDADDTLTAPEGFQWPNLTLPGYSIPVEYGDTTYSRCALVRSDAPWYWEGVLHEYLNSKVPLEQGTLDQPRIKVVGGGARSLDPEKFKKDVEVLKAALKEDPTNARYVFYLAQSYKDAGENELALNTYWQRAHMPGWVEETWYALYQIAIIKDWIHDVGITEAYLNAYQARPTRAEPLFHLAKYHRLKGEYALGYLYAQHGALMPEPKDKLFVDRSIYEWRLLEEWALNAYYVGEKAVGKRVFQRLINDRKAPVVDVLRFSESLKWYE